MRTYTADEYAAHQYHLLVGDALSRMAWAMRACFAPWRMTPLPGEWDKRVRVVDEFRARWRTGRKA